MLNTIKFLFLEDKLCFFKIQHVQVCWIQAVCLYVIPDWLHIGMRTLGGSDHLLQDSVVLCGAENSPLWVWIDARCFLMVESNTLETLTHPSEHAHSGAATPSQSFSSWEPRRHSWKYQFFSLFALHFTNTTMPSIVKQAYWIAAKEATHTVSICVDVLWIHQCRFPGMKNLLQFFPKVNQSTRIY